MRPYEVMIILDASLEEDAIRAQIDKAQDIIRTNGGNPTRVDRWGKRRFAYEVKHQWEGYYVLIEATSEPIAMSELDRALHLADEVVRHKVIRLPEGVAGQSKRTGAPAAEGEGSADGATSEAATPAGAAAARSEQ
jgi:small subunit ribosomal protein S6